MHPHPDDMEVRNQYPLPHWIEIVSISFFVALITGTAITLGFYYGFVWFYAE